LLGTVEPLRGFIQNRRHLVLPHIDKQFGLVAPLNPNLRVHYRGHTDVNAVAASQIVPQSPTNKSSSTISPIAGASLGIVYRCIWVKSPRMTAPRNSGVVRWWNDVVSHGPVLSVLLQAWECR
jgi:hypothetical protein